jgi:hypothetical protein
MDESRADKLAAKVAAQAEPLEKLGRKAAEAIVHAQEAMIRSRIVRARIEALREAFGRRENHPPTRP